MRYALNCFLLVVPIVLWNLVFTGSLPQKYSKAFFWKDIPATIWIPENILRVVVFSVPILMPLSITGGSQKIGFGAYLVGVAAYFLSWIPQIALPESRWSGSLLGFLAPAYTPLIWLIGIGLIGDTLFLGTFYRPLMYIAISICFVILHTTHAYVVYKRL